MPNHVTTEVSGNHRALVSLVNDGGVVDFSCLLPEPENIERGGCSGSHEPGVVCWYSWNVETWGTKWNAYSSTVTEGLLHFDTAWSHPDPVILALSEKHPDETFEVKYADEDLGYNLGHYFIRGGRRVQETVLDDGSDEALEFAAQLKYGQSYAELQAEWED